MTDRLPDKRLSELLDNWARWQRIPNMNLWYPPKSIGIAPSGSHDFDSMLADVDRDLAQAVESIVWDLPLNERDAVFHVKLAAVYRLREPIQVVYERARGMIRDRLIARGVE